MAGSICGLPCYVPPDRFCLVHNIPGALQLHGNMDGPQLARHPEGIPLCSRELTVEELAVQGEIHRKIMEAAADEAKALGAEITASEVEAQDADPLADTSKEPSTTGGKAPDGRSGRSGDASFVCPEHTEFTPKCRFCLAQAVAEGPFDPQIEVWISGARGEALVPFSGTLEAALLQDASKVEQVQSLRPRRALGSQAHSGVG